MNGTLYLLPNFLSEDASFEESMPAILCDIVGKLDGLIAESPKEGRRFLKRMQRSPHEVPQQSLNEHTTNEDVEALLEPIKKGEVWGYVTDAGVPCLADPGASLVFAARKALIPVQTVVGPSSLLLAMILSGLPCQKFFFHGYLPKDPTLLGDALKKLEEHSLKEGVTELWIETPYRNQKMFDRLLKELRPSTWLCIASQLTSKDEFVNTQTIAAWKKGTPPNLDNRPTVYLLRATKEV